MIPKLLLLVACTLPAVEVVPDADVLYETCRGGHTPSCYALRDSTDAATRVVALGKACDNHHKDACRLQYSHTINSERLGSAVFAFTAALEGCRSGDASLCHAALDFPQVHPDRASMVERHRAELGALLQKTEAGPD